MELYRQTKRKRLSDIIAISIRICRCLKKSGKSVKKDTRRKKTFGSRKTTVTLGRNYPITKLTFV
jgi:hypothetical protein